MDHAVYAAVSEWFRQDSANQTADIPYPFANPPVAYPDYAVAQGGYLYLNPPLAVSLPGIDDGRGHSVMDINHWQRLQIIDAVDQNGFRSGLVQFYPGPQWLHVRPFALERNDPARPRIDPGPPPWFGGSTHAEFVREVIADITAASHLDAGDGVLMDISPAVQGNNSLDFAGQYGNGQFEIYDGQGHARDPVTGLPYCSHLVKRGDYARVEPGPM